MPSHPHTHGLLDPKATESEGLGSFGVHNATLGVEEAVWMWMQGWASPSRRRKLSPS